MRLIFRSTLSFTRYKVPYNINRQEHATYLKKVERAEKTLDESAKVELVPRRKRRIYDRPRVDRNIEGYGAWRVFEQQQIIHKGNEHSMEVARKIMIQPKWLIHAFGLGALPVANPRSSHREYYFQDNRLNNYLLYEYRNTTHFRQNVEDYDYEHQQHLHPRARIQKRMEPEQFWKSQQKFEFRLNTSVYAEKFKFQEWLLKEIQKKKTQKSYDEYIDEKYGKTFSFNLKEESGNFKPFQPIVAKVCPEHFNPKKGKQPEPKVQLGKKLDESLRIKAKVTDIKGENHRQQTQQK